VELTELERAKEGFGNKKISVETKKKGKGSVVSAKNVLAKNEGEKDRKLP